jgi:hypothetical protein
MISVYDEKFGKDYSEFWCNRQGRLDIPKVGVQLRIERCIFSSNLLVELAKVAGFLGLPK